MTTLPEQPFYNPIIIEQADLERMRVVANDVSIGRRVYEILARHYPGHLWMVWPSSHRGILVIRNYALSQKAGAALKLSNIKNEADLERRVMRMGGEFLERFDLRRGAYRPGDYSRVRGRMDVTGRNRRERSL